MGFRETFVANLPSNPDSALLALADRAMEWLESPDNGRSDLESIIIRSTLDAFIGRLRPEIFEGGEIDEDDVKSYVSAIMRHAGSMHLEKLLEDYETNADSAKDNFGRTELDREEKEELHSHLAKLREIIEGSDLLPRKKNGLLSRLNALAAEIDRFGTRTDRFFAFASDLGFYMGDFAKNSQPLWAEVKDVLKIVTKARAREERLSLPAGDEILQLPKPKSDEPKGQK